MPQNGTLHVIVFTDSYLETSGVGTYYRSLVDWCRTRDEMRVTIVCPEPARRQDYEPTEEVIPLRPKLKCSFPLYPDLTVGYYAKSMLRKLMRSMSGTRVIHIASSGPLGVAAAKVARAEGLPIVGCYHTDMRARGRIYGRKFLGSFGGWLGDKVLGYYDRLAYGGCDGTYTPSESARQMVRAAFPGKTEVIPYEVDVHRFQPGSSRNGWFRERYQKKNALLAIVVGRVCTEESVDELCRLLGDDERIALVFVGGGPESSRVKRYSGVEVTGFLQGKQLTDAYQQADVFVQISRSETYGLCLIEALSCGLPAVVLRAPGLASNLPPDCGAVVLESDELPMLADRCVTLASDPARHQDYARQARAFAMTQAAEESLAKCVEFHKAYAR